MHPSTIMMRIKLRIWMQILVLRFMALMMHYTIAKGKDKEKE